MSGSQINSEIASCWKSSSPKLLASAWALQGLAKYHRSGLSAPQAVKDATGEYRDDQDVVGQFLDARCVIDGSTTTTGRSLYWAYKAWAVQSGDQCPMKEKRFSQSLAARHELKRLRSGSGMVWEGVRLLSEISVPAEELMVN